MTNDLLPDATSIFFVDDLCSVMYTLLSSAQFSPVWLFVTLWTAACQESLSIINSQRLLKFMSIKSLMPSNHLILCWSLLFLPSIFPIIRGFSNELTLPIRWPKYWSFSFSISLSTEYSGLISSMVHWFDLLANQGSSPAPQFKSIHSHHSPPCGRQSPGRAALLTHSCPSILPLSLQQTKKNH